MYLAFALAIMVAVLVVATQKVQRSAHRRLMLSSPGYSADRPLVVTDYADLDAFRDRARCPACGKGRLHLLGEGTVSGPSGVLTRMRTECLRCEERVGLYFDVSGVPS